MKAMLGGACQNCSTISLSAGGKGRVEPWGYPSYCCSHTMMTCGLARYCLESEWGESGPALCSTVPKLQPFIWTVVTVIIFCTWLGKKFWFLIFNCYLCKTGSMNAEMFRFKVWVIVLYSNSCIIIGRKKKRMLILAKSVLDVSKLITKQRNISISETVKAAMRFVQEIEIKYTKQKHRFKLETLRATSQNTPLEQI